MVIRAFRNQCVLEYVNCQPGIRHSCEAVLHHPEAMLHEMSHPNYPLTEGLDQAFALGDSRTIQFVSNYKLFENPSIGVLWQGVRGYCQRNEHFTLNPPFAWREFIDV